MEQHKLHARFRWRGRDDGRLAIEDGAFPDIEELVFIRANAPHVPLVVLESAREGKVLPDFHLGDAIERRCHVGGCEAQNRY